MTNSVNETQAAPKSGSVQEWKMFLPRSVRDKLRSKKEKEIGIRRDLISNPSFGAELPFHLMSSLDEFQELLSQDAMLREPEFHRYYKKLEQTGFVLQGCFETASEELKGLVDEAEEELGLADEIRRRWKSAAIESAIATLKDETEKEQADLKARITAAEEHLAELEQDIRELKQETIDLEEHPRQEEGPASQERMLDELPGELSKRQQELAKKREEHGTTKRSLDQSRTRDQHLAQRLEWLSKFAGHREQLCNSLYGSQTEMRDALAKIREWIEPFGKPESTQDSVPPADTAGPSVDQDAGHSGDGEPGLRARISTLVDGLELASETSAGSNEAHRGPDATNGPWDDPSNGPDSCKVLDEPGQEVANEREALERLKETHEQFGKLAAWFDESDYHVRFREYVSTVFSLRHRVHGLRYWRFAGALISLGIGILIWAYCYRGLSGANSLFVILTSDRALMLGALCVGLSFGLTWVRRQIIERTFDFWNYLASVERPWRPTHMFLGLVALGTQPLKTLRAAVRWVCRHLSYGCCETPRPSKLVECGDRVWNAMYGGTRTQANNRLDWTCRHPKNRCLGANATPEGGEPYSPRTLRRAQCIILSLGVIGAIAIGIAGMSVLGSPVHLTTTAHPDACEPIVGEWLGSRGDTRYIALMPEKEVLAIPAQSVTAQWFGRVDPPLCPPGPPPPSKRDDSIGPMVFIVPVGSTITPESSSPVDITGVENSLESVARAITRLQESGLQVSISNPVQILELQGVQSEIRNLQPALEGVGEALKTVGNQLSDDLIRNWMVATTCVSVRTGEGLLSSIRQVTRSKGAKDAYDKLVKWCNEEITRATPASPDELKKAQQEPESEEKVKQSQPEVDAAESR